MTISRAKTTLTFLVHLMSFLGHPSRGTEGGV